MGVDAGKAVDPQWRAWAKRACGRTGAEPSREEAEATLEGFFAFVKERARAGEDPNAELGAASGGRGLLSARATIGEYLWDPRERGGAALSVTAEAWESMALAACALDPLGDKRYWEEASGEGASEALDHMEARLWGKARMAKMARAIARNAPAAQRAQRAEAMRAWALEREARARAAVNPEGGVVGERDKWAIERLGDALRVAKALGEEAEPWARGIAEFAEAKSLALREQAKATKAADPKLTGARVAAMVALMKADDDQGLRALLRMQDFTPQMAKTRTAGKSLLNEAFAAGAPRCALALIEAGADPWAHALLDEEFGRNPFWALVKSLGWKADKAASAPWQELFARYCEAALEGGRRANPSDPEGATREAARAYRALAGEDRSGWPQGAALADRVIGAFCSRWEMGAQIGAAAPEGPRARARRI